MTKKTIYQATGGRLGNQLFQLIGGYSLARKYDCDFKIVYNYDPLFFEDKQTYNVLIDKFKQLCGDDVFVDKYPDTAAVIERDDTFTLLSDDYFAYVINNNDEIAIEHLLQHKNYIDENIVNEIISPDDNLINYIKNKYGNLSDTVAISVRRGDYLNCMNVFMLPVARWYLDTYYEYFSGKNILISSDDIEWCRENLKFDGRVKVQYCKEHAETALIVLSMCKGGFIGSNSTFSWWGAYLGEDGKHDIVFPDVWFNPGFCDKNIICDTWKTKSIVGLYEGYMDIDVYTLCYNEIAIIPYVVDYWKRFARHVYVFDNGSTDGSIEYLSRYGWISVLRFESENSFNNMIHQQIKNNCWKGNEADFVVVCDIDECLYDENLFNKLYYMKTNNQTISHTLFLETVSQTIPEHQPDKLYHEYDGVRIITNPEKLNFNDKCLIFDPKKIINVNYTTGSHVCEPEGEVRYYNLQTSYPLKTIHIKNLSLDYKLNRTRMYKERLSQDDLAHNMCFQYLYDEQRLIDDFNDDLQQSTDYANLFVKN